MMLATGGGGFCELKLIFFAHDKRKCYVEAWRYSNGTQRPGAVTEKSHG